MAKGGGTSIQVPFNLLLTSCIAFCPHAFDPSHSFCSSKLAPESSQYLLFPSPVCRGNLSAHLSLSLWNSPPSRCDDELSWVSGLICFHLLPPDLQDALLLVKIHFDLTWQNICRSPLHTPRTPVSRSHFHASSHHLHLFCIENNSDGHIILLPMGWISSTFVLKRLRISPQSWTWCCGPGCSSPPSPSSSLPAPHVVCGEQTKGRQSLLSWTNCYLLLNSILIPCSELIDWPRQMCRGMESAIFDDMPKPYPCLFTFWAEQ